MGFLAEVVGRAPRHFVRPYIYETLNCNSKKNDVDLCDEKQSPKDIEILVPPKKCVVEISQRASVKYCA